MEILVLNDQTLERVDDHKIVYGVGRPIANFTTLWNKSLNGAIPLPIYMFQEGIVNNLRMFLERELSRMLFVFDAAEYSFISEELSLRKEGIRRYELNNRTGIIFNADLGRDKITDSLKEELIKFLLIKFEAKGDTFRIPFGTNVTVSDGTCMYNTGSYLNYCRSVEEVDFAFCVVKGFPGTKRYGDPSFKINEKLINS